VGCLDRIQSVGATDVISPSRVSWGVVDLPQSLIRRGNASIGSQIVALLMDIALGLGKGYGDCYRSLVAAPARIQGERRYVIVIALHIQTALVRAVTGGRSPRSGVPRCR